MVGGDDKVTRFYDPRANYEYDVQLRLREKDRDDPSLIGLLWVPRAGGGIARLDSLVTLAPSWTASRVDRLDRAREARLRANVAPGYAPRRPRGRVAPGGCADGPARRLRHHHLGAGARAGADLRRADLGLRAVRGSCT